MRADYPTTLKEAWACLAMRPVERWKVTTTPDGAMERCADLLAAEVERLTGQLDAISEEGTAELNEAQAIREENRALKAQLASSVSASEARRREREAFVQGVAWRSVVGVCAGSQVGDEVLQRFPEVEVPNGRS